MAKRKKPAVASPAVSKSPAVSAEEWSIFRSISWWSLLALVFITPVMMSNWSAFGMQLPLTYDQFDIIKVFIQRLFALIALGAWVWDIMLRGGKIRHSPINWLILIFLGWVTLSTIFSIHPPTAVFGKYRRFEGLLSFITYAVIYFLTVQLADRPSRIKTLLRTLFFSSLIVAGYGVLQSFGMDPFDWGQLPFEVNRAFSTYGNPDLLGGFLMFSIFISLGLALAEENLTWRTVYWSGFLLNVWCVIAAFTRSAWVGMAAGMVFIVVFAIRQRARWTTVDWSFSAAVAAVAGAVIAKSLSSTNDVMNFGKRIVSIFQFGEGSAQTRFQIWGAAWRAIQDRPILGFGPDTFRLLFPRYKPVEYVAVAGYLSVADNVHNYPLQLAAGIGIPGALLFFGIVGWVAVRSWPIVFSREGDSSSRLMMAGVWTACAAYIVHLFFGLSVTGTTFLLWTCMGLLVAPTARTIEVPRPAWGVIAASALTVVITAGVFYQFVYIAADRAYLMSKMTTGEESLANARRAVRLNPFNDIYRSEVGVALTDQFIAAINSQSASSSDVLALFDQAQTALRDTIAFVPSEYDNYVFLTNLYNIAGQVIDPSYYDQAIEVGLAGIEVERYGPAIRLQLARAYASKGEYALAEKHLEYAIKMDPNYADAAVLLAQVYVAQGKTDEAIALLQKYPNSSTAVSALAAIEASATSETTQ